MQRCWSRAEQEGGFGASSSCWLLPLPQTLGFGGLHAPSPALLGGIQIFPWVPAGKCPTGNAAEEGRAGTSRRVWKGRAALGNSLSSNGRAGAARFPASCHGPSPGGSRSSFEVAILQLIKEVIVTRCSSFPSFSPCVYFGNIF